MPQQPEIQNKSSNDQLLDVAKKLLEQSGIDPNDFDAAISALNIAKQQAPDNNEPKYTNYQDKTEIYPDVNDACIYKRGDTKSGIWYFRIWNSKKKEPVFRSLRTKNKEQALATARQMYRDIVGKIDRNERLKEITTDELIDIWVKRLEGKVSTIPHRGIVPKTFLSKKYWLSNWSEYIHLQRLHKTPIDKIKPSATRGFCIWLEERPKQTAKHTGNRSREQINNNVNEVLKMYHEVAVRDRYISSDNIPQIDRLPYQIDNRVKRDIPTSDEYEKLYKFLIHKYYSKKHNPDVDAREIEKRKIFKDFIMMLSNTGLRPKELLGVRKSEITDLTGTSENPDNVVIKVRADNAKTGKQRLVVSPVRKHIERIYTAYKKLGIEHEPTDYLFLNPNGSSKYYRKAFGRMIYNNRLKEVLRLSGLQEQLDREDRSLSLYSLRHYYCYLRLINKTEIHLLAKNMGTSVGNIESTYGHINTELHADELTKGMGSLARTETNVQTMVAEE